MTRADLMLMLSRKARLARAYKAAFLNPSEYTLNDHGREILADLRAFCRADATCVTLGKDGRIDTHATSLAEGRREVWLRLMEHLHLDDRTIQTLVGDEHA